MRSVKEYQKDNEKYLILSRLKNREKNNIKMKELNKKNSEIIKARAKLYYYNNIEKIKKKNHSNIYCLCGQKLKFHSLKSHKKSIFHGFQLKKLLLDHIELNFPNLLNYEYDYID